MVEEIIVIFKGNIYELTLVTFNINIYLTSSVRSMKIWSYINKFTKRQINMQNSHLMCTSMNQLNTL